MDKAATRQLVIAGNGMVGQRFIEEFVALESPDATDRWSVTVVGEESRPAYDRVALSTFFDGSTVEDLTLCDVEALAAQGVDLRLGTRVDAIERDQQVVRLSDGTQLAYDHLVLAMGSSPFVPPIPGGDAPGCFVYRTIDDLEAIKEWSEQAGVTSGVVVGGGLLGLEAANALQNLGLETHVVEMAERLMPQQLDDLASATLRRWITELGVISHLGFATAAIESEAGAPTGLRSADSELVSAQLVVFSAGIRPNHQIAEAAGLALGDRGGVAIDDRCTTTDPQISAIGEVACHHGRVYGLVGPGYAMARSLASVLHGGDERFFGADTSTKLKLLGIDVANFGTESELADRVEFTDPTSGVHRRVSVTDGQVVGGVLVGDISNYDILHAMSTGIMASNNVAALVLPAAIAGLASTADIELPDTALLCSCNSVCRGDVRDAVRSGCHVLTDVKAATQAGTGCGGCVPDVSRLITQELDLLGIDAKRTLCEHFDFTRQELFDLVRFHRYTTWVEVIAAHGTGRGCEVCRPTVASILASLSNGYVLGEGQGSLQDTNDHSLANMQRNGTYSVVPRVPGGEILPAQLIALGEIARDFGLYTKITGGQRVDLFGAQLHELPEIWRRVLDAGMESGHAYGKALRTVKSCVGDTWCRYGVQDAVSMAIRVEERYRGLRAPHKLKSAVSGCTRECAEAQSKDFGLIATETGWNLYLCGNGGRTPRHADLFAVDLTGDEVITYLDRFLMFYIRTADRLERTATWFGGLDGGIDYLRSVVIDDSLGICAELEADMARHVETYECEWTATLKEPERLSQFVEFVNVPDFNSTPVWIQERGQRIPATQD